MMSLVVSTSSSSFSSLSDGSPSTTIAIEHPQWHIIAIVKCFILNILTENPYGEISESGRLLA